MNWYDVQDTEIFIDIDSVRARNRAWVVLHNAIKKKYLDVDYVFTAPTSTDGHSHMIVVLKHPIRWAERLAWANWMGSDRFRLSNILMRANNGIKSDDLLVTPRVYHRKPDAVCHCTKKHNKKSVTDKCSALLRLVAPDNSPDYFPKIDKAPKNKLVRFPFGRTKAKDIKLWRRPHGSK